MGVLAASLTRGQEIFAFELWLRLLSAPGDSLGGARPKASVTDENGALCLAKFPSTRDTSDTGAREKEAHELAAILISGGASPNLDLEQLWHRMVFLYASRTLTTICATTDFCCTPAKAGGSHRPTT